MRSAVKITIIILAPALCTHLPTPKPIVEITTNAPMITKLATVMNHLLPASQAAFGPNA